MSNRIKFYLTLVGFVLCTLALGHVFKLSWASFLSASAAPADTITHTAEFNPGPIVAQDCETAEYVAWVNDTAAAVRLVAVDLWSGARQGAYADMALVVLRASDGAVVARYAQDRYADPTGDHQGRFVSFAPLGFALLPGDRLIVHACNCYVAGAETWMHPVAVFYFSG